jgi:N-acetylglucosamine malate deacetylase 1
MNPYTQFVADYARLVDQGKTFPLGGFPPAGRPDLPANVPKALFFAPHPDDECISGGLALRVMREARMKVINVAVTQGSKKERQAERYVELQNACEYLGFDLIATGPGGLEKINFTTRQQDSQYWTQCVSVIAAILTQTQPRVIFFPHLHDWNITHIGTYHLVMDALQSMPPSFECYLVETEFWGQMSEPNLMIEISSEDLADLVTATSFHIGEVQRNPYHLLLPAWMMDNVRRGSELVGGQGGQAPAFTFAALYRLRKWKGGAVANVLDHGKQISRAANVRELFA